MTDSTREKVKAAFVVLARNSDLSGVLDSIKQMEDRFNEEFQYPYVFLNEEEFSEDIKKLVPISSCIALRHLLILG